ncbi:hypothetical protein [Brevibacillus agri]|uniref:hypothetical protein n=1 Tax=Brevibacillus agri TaxID=51101 RepID=UPI0025B6F21C|nr:hypothetical protein [Brevibacillus agri]MDN4095479.1 hypothetical protein [Brevibacillus agri]
MEWGGGGHNLIGIIKGLQIEILENELRMLERLSEFATWVGKYPIPKDYSKKIPKSTPDGGVIPLTYVSIPTDKILIDEMFERFACILEMQRKN